MKTEKLFLKDGTVALNDLFVSVGGHEQTNVNFYQVVGLKGKKTVLLRQIAKMKCYEGDMHGCAKAVLDNFVSTKVLEKRVSSDLYVSINSYTVAKKESADATFEFSEYG